MKGINKIIISPEKVTKIAPIIYKILLRIKQEEVS